MSEPRCVNCRWWNGDKHAAIRSFTHESDRHGKCQHIVSSPALPNNQPARLFPVGVAAWLHTRFDFHCDEWEKEVV